VASSLAAITLGMRPSASKQGEFIPFERLSSGEKYALSFALATSRLRQSSGAPIIVMEEPETALYPSAIGQIMASLQEADAPQVIISSHSESVVRHFALEHIFVMDKERKPLRLSTCADDYGRMDLEALIMPGHTSALLVENVIVAEGAGDTIVSRDLNRLAATVDVSAEKDGKRQKSFASKNWCFFDAGGATRARAKAEALRKLGKKVVLLFDGDAEGLENAKGTYRQYPTFVYKSSQDDRPTIELALLNGLQGEPRMQATGCSTCAKKGGNIRDCMRNDCASGANEQERKRKLQMCSLAQYFEAKQFPPAFRTLLEQLDTARAGKIMYLDVEESDSREKSK